MSGVALETTEPLMVAGTEASDGTVVRPRGSSNAAEAPKLDAVVTATNPESLVSPVRRRGGSTADSQGQYRSRNGSVGQDGYRPSNGSVGDGQHRQRVLSIGDGQYRPRAASRRIPLQLDSAGSSSPKSGYTSDPESGLLPERPRAYSNRLVLQKQPDGGTSLMLETMEEDKASVKSDVKRRSDLIDILRKLAAEFLGTCMLCIAIIGGGIMAERLSPTDVGLQVFFTGMATGGGLTGIILMFGPVSGAHVNPAVSLVDYLNRDMTRRDLILYSMAQTCGAVLGAVIANTEFGEPTIISETDRNEAHLYLGEIIGTVTLLLVIHGCIRNGRPESVAFAVGVWICAGYFFTSSTVFVNPAATFGRMFTGTFAGISPSSAGPFIGVQFASAVFTYPLIHFFYPKKHTIRKDDNLYLRLALDGVQDLEDYDVSEYA